MPTGIATDEAQRVAAAAAGSLPLILADLERWVNLDTPGGEASALDRCAADMAHTVESYGLHPELVPEGDRGLYLHATLEGRGTARIALVGHHDTVFPNGTASERPFRRDSSRCYGPGVADMKGGLAVAAHAARLLADGPRPFAIVELISCPDEESRPSAFETIYRVEGFDAVLVLECGRPAGEVVSARKGAFWFQLRARGHAAHAGVEPDVGRNAALAIAREALRLAPLHHSRDGLTFQLTGLTGGVGLNTVPPSATLTGDLRAVWEHDLEWARAQVLAFDQHEGVEITFKDLGGPPPLERTPQVATLAAAAIELGASLGHSFGEATTGGVSDGSWTAHAGLPTLDGLGPVGGLDHGPHEYVETDTFATRCGVVAGLVAAIDAGLLA